MKKTNQKEKRKINPKVGMFNMIFGMFFANGIDKNTANRRAYHQVFLEGGNPQFVPQKHTIMSYAQQNRLAKKKRKIKK